MNFFYKLRFKAEALAIFVLMVICIQKINEYKFNLRYVKKNISCTAYIESGMCSGNYKRLCPERFVEIIKTKSEARF